MPILHANTTTQPSVHLTTKCPLLDVARHSTITSIHLVRPNSTPKTATILTSWLIWNKACTDGSGTSKGFVREAKCRILRTYYLWHSSSYDAKITITLVIFVNRFTCSVYTEAASEIAGWQLYYLATFVFIIQRFNAAANKTTQFAKHWFIHSSTVS